MQYRRRGSRTQVLAYRGYDKEKCRSIVSLLGSFHNHTHKLSPELEQNLTPAEFRELKQYLVNRKTEEEQDAIRNSIRSLYYNLLCIRKAAEEKDEDTRKYVYGLDQNVADNIWEDLIELEKALRKAGYKKPVKPKKPSLPQDTMTMNLLEND